MNSKIESIILCVVMVASISIPITQNVGESSSTLGGTIYVDDDNTSGIEDGSLQYPYNTIQEGVDAASSGDTVYVFNGMYYEHVIISKSYLILQGENRDTTRIDGGGSGHIINVDADYVDISGFTIKNGGRGIYVSNSIGITICDNYMSSSVSNNRGIYLTQTGQCDVYENTIQDNNGKGIFLDINCIYNDIFKNNLINNKDEGIRLASHSNNNNIFENIIQSSYGFGIYITQSSDDNTIRNNIIRDHPHSAIKVANTYPYGNNNRIYHNNFINNIASDGGTNIWDDGYPSGGNYWSDYGGNDFYHGSKQDIPGSDGIGDTPYPIPDGSNQDRYPFMNPISIFNKPPIPDAGSDQSIGEGDSVQFDGSASYDPDGTIVSYEWDFGDGSPIGTGVNPTHIYNTPGNYTVTLTVTDDDNATDSDTCIITVLAVIQPPNADAGPDQTVNEGDVVQFKGCNSTGSTDGDPPSVNPSVVALWHMNEGSGSIIYDETSNNNDGIISDASWTTGKFGSALRFEDTDIVYEIPASFDDSITTDITMVAWVYWEGPHPWTYSKNSYIFDARDFEGTRGGFILYLDPSGTLVFILLYGYNTGDYQIIRSTCKIPIKRWTHISGVLDYTNGDLKIYINGNEDTSVPATEPYYGFGGSHWDAAIGNNRYAPGDNQWAPFNGIIDEAVIYNRALTAQELPSTPAEIISYKWDFDDSDGIDWDNPDATGPTPTHIHGDNGVYIVTLKITDKTGATATDTCNITVLNVAPTVDLNGPYLGGEGSPITFTSMATDPGSDDLTFTWNWGDGTTATTSTYYNNGIGPEPIYDPSTNEIKSPEGTFPFDVTDTLSHTYGDNGVYTITLTVTDDDRGTTIITTNVVVNNVAPTITLAITPSGDEGSSLTFEAGATD
ncbi:MAG: PKD domain-containing protein, partial [Thermoplasmata archaeon]